MDKLLEVFRLGTLAYTDAWAMQKSMAQERAHQQRPDALLLLEHPHTYTLGSSGKLENLLMDEAERTQRGVSVYHVDRGGDITYHGPGQLVGYPIVRLPNSDPSPKRSLDVVSYVRQLETMLIEALAEFGIVGERLAGYTGVWVKVEGVLSKIAAIGVKVTAHRVTQHGFALNINTDLDYFRGIIPCGIPDKPVTSMAGIFGYPINSLQVMDAVEKAFANTFGYELVRIGAVEMNSSSPPNPLSTA
ncbi:MAG: lipoyl(octanoyl) transferase LipB [Anaerolineae bacterium]|nr:lipoyl(octanoyl) transferase LipB [Anaerolineae bacterium]